MKGLSVALVMIFSLTLDAVPGLTEDAHPYLLIGNASNFVRKELLTFLENEQSNAIMPFQIEAMFDLSNKHGEQLPSDDQPLVLVEQFANAPAQIHLQQILNDLGQRDGNATYLLFVDDSAEVDWVGSLSLPKNVRMSVSIKSVDAGELRYFYEKAGLSYDSEQVSIQYGRALSMAAAQIGASHKEDSRYQLSSWTSQKAYLGLFDDIVHSNASSEASAQLVDYFVKGTQLPNWNADIGVKVPPTQSSTEPTDIYAILHALAANGCKGSWKWDGFIDNGMAFQSVGQTRD